MCGPPRLVGQRVGQLKQSTRRVRVDRTAPRAVAPRARHVIRQRQQLEPHTLDGRRDALGLGLVGVRVRGWGQRLESGVRVSGQSQGSEVRIRGRIGVSDALSLGLQPLRDLPSEQRLVMRCGPGCSKGSGIGHLEGGSLEQPRPRLGAQCLR